MWMIVTCCTLIWAVKDSAFVTFEKMQESVMNWGKLLIASGGLYKPPKCFYHLISFNLKRDGKWYYEENHTRPQFKMVVPLPDGSTAVINHLPITEAKETLGVISSPDGNSKGAILAMQEKAQEWVDKAQEGLLRRRDIWFLLDCQFWPRVGYGLCCNLADLVTLKDSLASQYFKLLPLGGVIRTAPRAIRQLSKGFYGVGCPDPEVECLIGQVGKLLMHFGCSSNLGGKLKISYLQLVVELGLLEQPFQESFSHYKDMVTWSWLVSFWEKCERYEVTVVMNDSPLELPRERDKWLMQEFIRLGYTKKDLERLNQVRLFQQVLFLSDILGASGSTLDERYLRRCRKDEVWSTIKFPREWPPAADFRL
jgi:hypothetical protein